jgi:hypothetical protein
MKILALCFVAALTGCATRPAKVEQMPPTIPLPPMPPMLAVNVKKQAAPVSTAAAAASSVASASSTNSPEYGVAAKFIASYEDGKKTIGVYFQWNNWPPGSAYVVQRSTNLVTWTDLIRSGGDDGRVLVVHDLEAMEFYRISGQ